MIGIMLTLHFGFFHLLSCIWRSIGIDARPLMNWPGSSTRLSDFWGRRWNTAFRDLTHRFVFKPLTRRLGGVSALWIGFLVSGLLHDLVITVPAGGGYGGPTIYFLLQAAGLSIERRWRIGGGIRGWIFTMSFLVLPAPLLLHMPFVNGVNVPFMQSVYTHTSGGFQ